MIATNKPQAQKTSIQTTGNLDRYFEIIDEYPELFRSIDTRFDLVLDRDELETEQECILDENRLMNHPSHYYTLGVLAEDSFHFYLCELVRYSDGMLVPHERYILKRDLYGERAVKVVPYIEDQILLLREYSHFNRQWEWYVPNGYAQPGTDLFAEASHELRATTGFRLVKIFPLLQRPDDNSVVFMAEVSMLGRAKPTYTGDTIGEQRWFSLPELEKTILSGMITNPTILAAYIHVMRNGFSSQPIPASNNGNAD